MLNKVFKPASLFLTALFTVSALTACGSQTASMSPQILTAPETVSAQSALQPIVFDVSKLENSKNKINAKQKENSSGQTKNKSSKNVFKFNLPLKNSELPAVNQACYDAIMKMTGQRSNEIAYKMGRPFLDQMVTQGVYPAKLAAAAIDNDFRSDSANWYDGVKILMVAFTHILAKQENTPATTAELIRNIAYAPDKLGPAYFAAYAALKEVANTDNNDVRTFVLYYLSRSENFYKSNQTESAHNTLLEGAAKLGQGDLLVR